MSRLYANLANTAAIADQFGAEFPAGMIIPEQMIEGSNGLVCIERDGRRLLRLMHWGFPRLTDDEGPRRIGLVADLTNPLWNQTVVDPRFRCLIVLTHFANPDGVPGQKTRTWFSVENQPIIAWAGFCRNTQELGPVFAGMTMTANAAIPPTNDRMPVILNPVDYDRWLKGSVEDVIALQFGEPIDADLMVVERTPARWKSQGLPLRAESQFSFL